MREIICGIYCIKNIINGKVYVGFSSNIESRWKHHVFLLKNNKHDNIYLQSAWNKYGYFKFEFIILEECSVDELQEKEFKWIEKYKSFNRVFGYNLTFGMDGVIYVSDETRKKQSIVKSGKNSPMYGKLHSDNTKKQMSESGLGKVKKRKKSTSIYYGVFKVIMKNKYGTYYYWQARFNSYKEKIYVGQFKKEIDAAKAFDEKSWEIYHDLNKLNFPKNYKNK